MVDEILQSQDSLNPDDEEFRLMQLCLKQQAVVQLDKLNYDVEDNIGDQLEGTATGQSSDYCNLQGDQSQYCLEVETGFICKLEPDSVEYDHTHNDSNVSRVLPMVFGRTSCIVEGCDFCIDSWQSALEHMRLHHSQKCPIGNCSSFGITFTSEHKMLVHYFSNHLTLLECFICGEEFLSSALTLDHMDKHIACYQCGMEFDSFLLLKDHIEVLHKRVMESYTCLLCPRMTLKSGFKWLAHWRSVHLKLPAFRCMYCTDSFGTLDEYDEHLQAEHSNSLGFKCMYCEDACTRSTSLLLGHVAKNCQFRHCQICSYKTLHLPFLRIHIRRRHGIGAKPCHVEKCHYQAVGRYDYEQHVYSKHGIVDGVREAIRGYVDKTKEMQSVIETRINIQQNKKHQTCKEKMDYDPHRNIDHCYFPECVFRGNYDEVKTHVSQSHRPLPNWSASGRYGKGKRRSFLCHDCGRLCRDNADLRRHFSSRKLKCSQHCKCSWVACRVCNTKFMTVKLLVAHWNDEQNECSPSDDQKLLYTTELQTFNAEESKAIAETYSCSQCDFTSDKKGNLAAHAIVHYQGQEWLPEGASACHKCPLCPHYELTKQRLERHIFFHYKNGEQIPPGHKLVYYTCPFCDHICCDKSKLKRHLIVHRDKAMDIPSNSNISPVIKYF